MPPGRTHSTIAGFWRNITARHIIQNLQHSPVSCLCHVKDHTGSTPPVILGFTHIAVRTGTKRTLLHSNRVATLNWTFLPGLFPYQWNCLAMKKSPCYKVLACIVGEVLARLPILHIYFFIVACLLDLSTMTITTKYGTFFSLLSAGLNIRHISVGNFDMLLIRLVCLAIFFVCGCLRTSSRRLRRR